MKLKIKLNGHKMKTYEVKNLEEASRLYTSVRDTFGVGSSEISAGKVYEGRKQLAVVSYNGRIWSPVEYREVGKPKGDL